MKTPQHHVYILLGICLCISILYFAKAFLIPITLSIILAMLLIGPAQWLEQWKIARGFSSLFAVCLFLLGITVILALLYWRLSDFSDHIAGMKERALGMIERFKNWVDLHLGFSTAEQEALIKRQREQSVQASGMLLSFANSTINLFVNFVLVLVYVYLILYYRSRIKHFILQLVPHQDELKTKKILEESTQVSRHYLTGLATMIVLLWILYGIGFSLIGVENAIFFAVLCGILEIVPFIGNITGTSLTVLAVIAQGGETQQILGVIGVYLLIQFVQTYIMEPLVVGDRVHINPLFTIMALVAGELIWGIAGMVLAIPLLGIVKIICDHIPALRPYAYLIGTAKGNKKHIHF